MGKVRRDNWMWGSKGVGETDVRGSKGVRER